MKIISFTDDGLQFYYDVMHKIQDIFLSHIQIDQVYNAFHIVSRRYHIKQLSGM